jgi:hypothetical protein
MRRPHLRRLLPLLCIPVAVVLAADVFAMLARQPWRPQFTGGLEPKRLTRDVAVALRALKPESIFLAYDTPDDWPGVVEAATNLQEAGHHFAGHRIRCYVLIGGPGDTFEAADLRLRDVLALGVFPAAMLWRSAKGDTDPAWRVFQRQWFRPAIINSQQNLLAITTALRLGGRP